MNQSSVMPIAIRNTLKTGIVEMDWEDGHKSEFSHEFLRVHCPCASCVGHTPEQAKVIAGKENVRTTLIEQVGNYAIRIAFDDGHDSGIYTFERLHTGMLKN
ncbi:MAG: DUF971 domain-containing protein [Ghiorsea sp.]